MHVYFTIEVDSVRFRSLFLDRKAVKEGQQEALDRLLSDESIACAFQASVQLLSERIVHMTAEMLASLVDEITDETETEPSMN
jgi:hypothetical protein